MFPLHLPVRQLRYVRYQLPFLCLRILPNDQHLYRLCLSLCDLYLRDKLQFLYFWLF